MNWRHQIVRRRLVVDQVGRDVRGFSFDCFGPEDALLNPLS
jgi:hypothetical protein